MSKGGSSGSSTVTQSSEPPKYLLPYLKEAVEAAKGIYAKGPQPLYGGPTMAGINPTQQQGLNATLAYGNSGASPYATDSLNALQGMVNADPSKGNPYLDQLLQTYGEKANQMVASNFNSGGRYGSGSHAAAAGTAITNATLPILSDQYNKDVTNRMQAATILPSLANTQDQIGLNKAQAIGSVGDVYQGQDQNAINDAIERFKYEHGGGENDALNNYISQLNSNPLSKAERTTQTTTGAGGGIGSTIGGIVSGLGTLGGMGSGLASFLGGGSGLAGMLGGSTGMLGSALGFLGFSDERLKKDMKLVGTENGHNVYEFEYKHGEGQKYIGVKAQEVLEKNPEAVKKGGFGFLSVDYSKIGVKFRKVGASLPNLAAVLASSGGRVEASTVGGFAVNRGL